MNFLVDAQLPRRTAMRYFSGAWTQHGMHLASEQWGNFTYFIEVDGQYVNRQVNRYANGNVLRYDRPHWCDDFGCMFLGRFSHKQKAGRGMAPLTAAEFERIWVGALSSPKWSEQIARSREKDWGKWAEHITM